MAVPAEKDGKTVEIPADYALVSIGRRARTAGIGCENIGLLLVPIVIGAVNDATGSYVLPMIIFSSFGVAALFIGMLLKREDSKKGYGLELPNIKQ